MNRETILKALKTAGHGKLEKKLDALIRPAIYLNAKQLCHNPFDLTGKVEKHTAGPDKFDKAMAKLSLGASRFGGIPDLPPGVAWPSRDDVPMEFVAQIRLSEIAAHDAENTLPHDGSLLFFYNSQWQAYDEEDELDCCRVIFHDGPDDKLVRTPPPSILWQGEYDSGPRPTPFVHGIATLSFSRYEMPPGGVSPFIPESTPLGEIWQDFHCSYSETWSPVPEGKQYADNHLLGYVEAQDYVDAHANGKKDRCLLQIDSDDAADFQWGDCDRLYFLLTEKQLAARDFSKVRLYSTLG